MNLLNNCSDRISITQICDEKTQENLLQIHFGFDMDILSNTEHQWYQYVYVRSSHYTCDKYFNQFLLSLIDVLHLIHTFCMIKVTHIPLSHIPLI